MDKKYIVLASILFIMMILSPCCERGEFNWGTKIGNITYSGNVVFLGAEELALLKEVSSNKVVFSGNAGEIGNIADNSILLIGVSEKTPYGLLRKVTGIQKNGDETTISTSDGLLPDAIKEGTIKFQGKLLEKDFQLKSKVEGVLVKSPGKSFDGLAVTLDNLEVYNDGSKIARLNGAIGIAPEINITIDIRFNEINEINISTTLNKIDEVTVTSNGAFNGEKAVVAAEFVHSPVVIDSLVFVPEVTINCGYTGTISSDVSSGVRQDRVITSAMNYKLSKWSEDPLSHTENFDYIKPLVTDNSNLIIYSGPEITIRLFGVPVQVVNAKGFYSLEAEKTGTPLWRLFYGIEGFNSVKADILGLTENHSLNMTIPASEIGNAGSK
jgi:hypothetical protein